MMDNWIVGACLCVLIVHLGLLVLWLILDMPDEKEQAEERLYVRQLRDDAIKLYVLRQADPEQYEREVKKIEARYDAYWKRKEGKP